MCSINHDLKAIFIHTPKCGGLFVEKLLDSFYGFKTFYFTHENHSEFIDSNNRNNLKQFDNSEGFLKITQKGVLRYFMTSEKHNNAMNMTIEKWNEYTKFAVIRNPYDRIVSSYKYLQKITNIATSFKDFLSSSDNIDSYCYFHTFINQYDNLININNEYHIDYTCRFENLNEDLCEVLLKIGVDKIKHREQLLNHIKINKAEESNYCDVYDSKILNIVNTIFEKDFNFMHFKKNITIDDLLNDSKNYFVNFDEFAKKNIQLIIKLDKINKIVDLNYNKVTNIKEDDKLLLDNGVEIILDKTNDQIKQPSYVLHAENFLTVFKNALKKHSVVDNTKK